MLISDSIHRRRKTTGRIGLRISLESKLWPLNVLVRSSAAFLMHQTALSMRNPDPTTALEPRLLLLRAFISTYKRISSIPNLKYYLKGRLSSTLIELGLPFLSLRGIFAAGFAVILAVFLISFFSGLNIDLSLSIE